MLITEFENRARYQNGYDREFDNWKIIDIHQIPTDFTEGTETDFYCSNGKKVYLLRLIYDETESYKINNETKNLEVPSYLIARFPIQIISDHVINHVLSKFKLD